MKVEIEGLRERLKTARQEHILLFWNELNNKEKIAFSSQIENINLDQINKLYENSKIDENFNPNTISPIKYVEAINIENKEKYMSIGERAIRNGEIAVISMAGGQRN